MEETNNVHKSKECPICFIESSLVTLPCSPCHRICVECLVKIQSEIYVMRNCPFCRQRLPKDFVPPGYTKDDLNNLQQKLNYKPHTVEELNFTSPYELIFIASDNDQPISSINPQQEQLLDNLVYNFRGMNRQRHQRSRSYREQQHRSSNSSHTFPMRPRSNSFSGEYRRPSRRKSNRPKLSKKKRVQSAERHRRERKQYNKSRAPQANPLKYRSRHRNMSRYHYHRRPRVSRSSSPNQNRIAKT